MRDPFAEQLSAEDQAALRELWWFYKLRNTAIANHLREAVTGRAELARVLATLTQGVDGLHERALLAGEWEPLLATMRERGAQSSEAGISYAAWRQITRACRDAIQRELRPMIDGDPVPALAIWRGANLLIEITAECITDAYLAIDQHAVFERSPLPMWMLDRDTLRFLMVNEAAVRHYGFTQEEFRAMTLAEVRRSEDLVALREEAERAELAPRARKHWKKDGTTISVEIHATNFELEGRPVRLCLISDVTDRVRAEEVLRKTEEQLHHAQKMEALGRLAGNVAHDFNNILTVVQTYSCLLEDSFDRGDERLADASEIRRAAERAQGITRQLLTMSRRGVVEPRTLDVDEVVAEFKPMLERLLGETITLVVRPGGAPTIVADKGQIEQVLMNLAVNAKDAMPAGGRFTIESRVLELETEAAGARKL